MRVDRTLDRPSFGRTPRQKLRAYIVGMPNTPPLLADLSDHDLVATVARLAARERGATANLLAALGELDARTLYLEDGCASLFTSCTQRLHLSEAAAYHRITAARVARRFPVTLERLREGALTLTTVCLLAPHLTDANYVALLDAARHLGKRAVEELLARLQPRPEVASSVRKMPARGASVRDRRLSAGATGCVDRAEVDILAWAATAQADNRSVALTPSPLPEESGAAPDCPNGDPPTWRR